MKVGWLLALAAATAGGVAVYKSLTPVFKVGFYYVWHYEDDYDANWFLNIEPGVIRALLRWGGYMVNNDSDRDINYGPYGEFYTTADIGHGHGMHEDYDHDQAILAVNQVCRTKAFQKAFDATHVMFIVFANTHDCFGPLSRYGDLLGTRPTPLYIGELDFPWEVEYGTCGIEHELFVVFGIPELTEDPGEPTIMYDLYLPEIVLTESERQLAKWRNLQKGTIGVDFCFPIPDLEVSLSWD